jgi:iron complex outermembrane receptor protein
MNKIILCALATACLLTVNLAAQTQEEQSDIEVFVTASRVEEPTEEIPAFVSVITAEELVATGQTTLVEALDGLAGIYFRSYSGNPAQAQVSMRGFGENSNGRVLVLIDGRRLNRPDMAGANWLQIPVENVERVEVVRGGSSVLYGDNAVAGVINIITKKGAAGFDVAVSGQYGSFNQNQEGVEVSGSNDLLSFSITGEHTSTDGYRDRSGFRSLAVGGSIALDLKQLSSELSLSYNRLFYEMPGELTKPQFEADPTQSVNPDDESHNQYVNADLAFALGPADRWLLDGNLGYGLKLIESDQTSQSNFSDLLINTVAVTPKLHVNTDVLAGNSLLLGIDGYLERLNVKKYPNAARSSLDAEHVITKTTVGTYATNEISLVPMLSVMGGLRYELSWIKAETLTGTSIDENDLLQNLAYEAGFFVTPRSGSRLWVKYGRVYRYPFVDEIADLYDSPFIASPFNTDLDPETGHNVELGGASELFGLLKLSVNLYWLEMQDEIAYDFPSLSNVNLDATRHLGVETEIFLSIQEWAELSANYTFTSATFTEGANKGNTIPLVPAQQAGADLTLHLPLDLSVGVSGRYVSDQYSGGDVANSLDKLDAYFLMGVFVRYKPEYVRGDLDLFLGVNNLLDAQYATMAFYGASYYPGEGRNWKLGASYRY